MRPMMIIPIVLGAAATAGVLAKRDQLDPNQVPMIIVGIIAFFSLFCLYCGGLLLLVALSFLSMLILGHGCCRCRSSKSKIAAHMQNLSPEHSDKFKNDIIQEFSAVRKMAKVSTHKEYCNGATQIHHSFP